ncbi:hypothetical protein GCM10009415_34870 [Chitinophaga japonensis]
MQAILPLFRMHTQQFDNALRDIKDEDALVRIEGRTNHITWMVGNLVNCRYWLANVLGMPHKDPYEDLFNLAKALDPQAQYPDLATLKKEWHTISPLVFRELQQVTDAKLGEAYPFGMNVDFIEENRLNMTGLSLDRESYLLGQLGFMRRILGYEGVKYDINKELSY